MIVTNVRLRFNSEGFCMMRFELHDSLKISLIDLSKFTEENALFKHAHNRQRTFDKTNEHPISNKRLISLHPVGAQS